MKNQHFRVRMNGQHGPYLDASTKRFPDSGHILLPRWRTHTTQEAPQWFSLCGANALPGIPQINGWFFGPKYREWVDMTTTARNCFHPNACICIALSPFIMCGHHLPMYFCLR